MRQELAVLTRASVNVTPTAEAVVEGTVAIMAKNMELTLLFEGHSETQVKKK